MNKKVLLASSCVLAFVLSTGKVSAQEVDVTGINDVIEVINIEATVEETTIEVATIEDDTIEDDTIEEVTVEDTTIEEATDVAKVEEVDDGVEVINVSEVEDEVDASGVEVNETNYNLTGEIDTTGALKTGENNYQVNMTNKLTFDIKDGSLINMNDYISFISKNLKLFELEDNVGAEVKTDDGDLVGNIYRDVTKQTLDTSRVGYEVPTNVLETMKASDVGGNYAYKLVFNDAINKYKNIILNVTTQVSTNYMHTVNDNTVNVSISDASGADVAQKQFVNKGLKDELQPDRQEVTQTGVYQNTQVFNKNTLESVSAGILNLHYTGDIQQFKAGDVIEFDVLNKDIWNVTPKNYYVGEGESYQFTAQGVPIIDTYMTPNQDGVYVPTNGTLDFTYLSADNGTFRFRINKDIDGPLPFAGFDEFVGSLKKIDSTVVDPETGDLKQPFEVKITHTRSDGSVVSEEVQTPDVEYLGVWTSGDGTFVPSHAVRVEYVYEDGKPVFPDNYTGLFKEGDQYTVDLEVPKKEGFTSTTSDILSGIMPEGGGIVVTYIYKKDSISPIPFEEIRRFNKDMVPGSSDVVVQEGENGSKNDTTGEILKQPVDRIVEYAPQERGFETSYVPSEEGSKLGEQTVITEGKNEIYNPETNEIIVEGNDEVIGVSYKEQEVEPIPNKTVYVPNNEKEVTYTKEITSGNNGENTLYYEYSVDPKTGALSNKTLVNTVKTKDEEDKVIEVGTLLSKETAIGFDEIRRPNKNLLPGEEVVVQEGVEGKTVEIYMDELDIVTGKLKGVPKLINTDVTKSQDRIIEYGPEREKIPFETIRRPNKDLQPNEEKVVQEGKEGEKFKDGEIIEESQDRIIEYGPEREKPVDKPVEKPVEKPVDKPVEQKIIKTGDGFGVGLIISNLVLGTLGLIKKRR